LEVEVGDVPQCPTAGDATAFNPEADPGFGKEFIREYGGGSPPLGSRGAALVGGLGDKCPSSW